MDENRELQYISRFILLGHVTAVVLHVSFRKKKKAEHDWCAVWWDLIEYSSREKSTCSLLIYDLFDLWLHHSGWFHFFLTQLGLFVYPSAFLRIGEFLASAISAEWWCHRLLLNIDAAIQETKERQLATGSFLNLWCHTEAYTALGFIVSFDITNSVMHFYLRAFQNAPCVCLVGAYTVLTCTGVTSCPLDMCPLT